MFSNAVELSQLAEAIGTAQAEFPVLAVYGSWIREIVDRAEARATGPQPVDKPKWSLWGESENA